MKKILIKLLFSLIFIFTLPVFIFAEPDLQNELNNAKLFYYYDHGNSYQKFNQIVTDFPDNDQARLNLIRILRENGQYTEAISHLKILQQQNPQEQRYRLALLQTTYLVGQLKETVELSNTTNLTSEELYWRGLAFQELGRDKEAIQTLTESLTNQPFNPMAYYRLGQLYQKAADYEKAIISYKKAAAQDPNMGSVYFPLAQCYMAQERYSLAYSYLVNAKNEAPWNHEIQLTFKKLTTSHPEIFRQQETEVPTKPQVIKAPKVTYIVEGRARIPTIRVGLAEKIRRLYLKTAGPFYLADLNGRTRFTWNEPMTLVIKQNNHKLEIYNRWGELLVKSSLNISLIYNDPALTTVLYEVQYVNGSFWAGREKRTYRGRFQFLPRDGGLTIVNRLNLEEYLYGVVPAEMESTWPAAASEAQAIAARTYAISHLNYFKSRGFDVLATTASQVYNGVKVERKTSNTAVDVTRGQILTYNGNPISAFYTGNCGGYTANSQDLWGIDVPYLQAAPDKLLPPQTELMGPEELAEWLTSRPMTYSSYQKYFAPSQYRWTAWVSHLEIENRLKLGEKLGRITAITIMGQSIAGVVTKVLIKGTAGEYVLTGDIIRSKLGGLRSNMFIVEPKMGKDGLPECFIFNGGGWGHGVGMCQCGAAGMAADGYKCVEILKHYYPGVELTKKY